MWKNKYILTPIFTGLALVFLAVILTVTKLSFSLDIDLITRFEYLRGIRSFGTVFSVLFFIFVSILYMALDFFLVWFLYSSHRFYAYLLSYSAFLLGILTLIYVGAIISVN